MNITRERQLVNNTLILTLGTFCTKVISFVAVPFFSKWLSTDDYGLFDLFSTYISLLFPLITLSIGEGAFRFLVDSKTDRERTNVLSSSVFVFFLGTGVSIIVGLLMTLFIDTTLAVAFIILLVAELLYSFSSYIVRGYCQLKHYAISGILFTVTMCLSVFLFVYILKWKLVGIMLGYSIGYLMSFIYLLIVIHPWKHISFKTISKAELRRLLQYSLPLIPNTISWWIINASDRIVISFFIGNAANGIYAIANKIPSICSSVFSVFHLSWQENSSLSINDIDRDEYFNKIYNRMIPLLAAIAMCVISTNFFMFEFIFDIKYTTAKYHVPILILSIVFSFIAQFYGGIFVALKKTIVNGSTTVITGVINLIVNLSLIQFIGLYAASISTFVSHFLLYSIRKSILKKHVKIKISQKSIISIAIMFIYFTVEFFLLDIPVSFIVFLIELFLVLFSLAFFLIVNKKITISILRKLVHKTDLKLQ